MVFTKYGEVETLSDHLLLAWELIKHSLNIFGKSKPEVLVAEYPMNFISLVRCCSLGLKSDTFPPLNVIFTFYYYLLLLLLLLE